MKANRKFRDEDDAVSPVIAVILMVAITVVLAATVYVWVSGFGSQSSQAAKTMALTSAGSISQEDLWDAAAVPEAAGADGTDDFYRKVYTVASATPGMRYSDFSATINGVALTFESTNCSPTPGNPTGTTGNLWSACGSAARLSTDTVSAGDRIVVQHATALSGATLRLVDSQANSVMLTLVIG